MSKYGAKVNNLIADVKKGKADAFKRLFDLTYNHLIVVARRYLVDKNDCEDVLSEAYLNVFKYIQTFNGDKDGYNWMCRIVQNVAYTYNSKRAPMVDLFENQVTDVNFEDASIFKGDMAAALNKLPADVRELVYLKFWQDMSYSEIAEAKGLKKSSVHKKVSAAVKKILKDYTSPVDD